MLGKLKSKYTEVEEAHHLPRTIYIVTSMRETVQMVSTLSSAKMASEFVVPLITLAIFILAAFLVTHFIGRVVRTLATRTATPIDDQVLRVLNTPLRLAIILVGFNASILQLSIVQSQPMLLKAASTGFPILWILLGGTVAYRVINIVLTYAGDLIPTIGNSLRPMGTVVRLLVVLSVVLSILGVAGIDISPYVLGWGLLGFAIVLALQPVLQDFISGLYVSLAQPYRVGDQVQLPTGEICEIVDIKAQQTLLYNVIDQQYLRIPNTDLMKTKIMSTGEKGLALNISFKIKHDSDLERAKGIALEIVRELPQISKEPSPAVYLMQLDGTIANFEIVAWIKDPADRRSVLDAVNTTLTTRFKEAGLQFAS